MLARPCTTSTLPSENGTPCAGRYCMQGPVQAASEGSKGSVPAEVCAEKARLPHKHPHHVDITAA